MFEHSENSHVDIFDPYFETQFHVFQFIFVFFFCEMRVIDILNEFQSICMHSRYGFGTSHSAIVADERSVHGRYSQKYWVEIEMYLEMMAGPATQEPYGAPPS